VEQICQAPILEEEVASATQTRFLLHLTQTARVPLQRNSTLRYVLQLGAAVALLVLARGGSSFLTEELIEMVGNRVKTSQALFASIWETGKRTSVIRAALRGVVQCNLLASPLLAL